MYRNKYGSYKVVNELGKFDSKREYQRYLQLLHLQEEGFISDLKRQVPFILLPKQTDANKKSLRELKYIADFTYKEGSREVVEDCKGYRTSEYKIKKKLMLWMHGITIRET